MSELQIERTRRRRVAAFEYRRNATILSKKNKPLQKIKQICHLFIPLISLGYKRNTAHAFDARTFD